MRRDVSFASMSTATKVILSCVVLSLINPAPAAFAQSQSSKTTTALQNAPTPEAQPASSGTFITFTKKGSGGITPDATFGCSVGTPSVTDTFSSRTATWTASISCSIAVGLYGTTVLFHYPSGPNVAYGNQINTTSTAATSSGSYSGLSTGSYEVNFNIDITPPAGYTTNASGYCSYVNGGPEVFCSVPSGSFSQP
jgi:hypothetical protein